MAIDAEETLDDVLSLCSKILHDDEETRHVLIVDLILLRDRINDLRAHISQRGYKTLPRILKDEPESYSKYQLTRASTD